MARLRRLPHAIVGIFCADFRFYFAFSTNLQWLTPFWPQAKYVRRGDEVIAVILKAHGCSTVVSDE
jgi:arginine exporter protein ArgO